MLTVATIAALATIAGRVDRLGTRRCGVDTHGFYIGK